MFPLELLPSLSFRRVLPDLALSSLFPVMCDFPQAMLAAMKGIGLEAAGIVTDLHFVFGMQAIERAGTNISYGRLLDVSVLPRLAEGRIS